jgi:hypothetical protein
MNLAAYARHRKERGLRGGSHVAVLKAIQQERLTPPAVRRDGRNWVIDPVLADQQWAARTDPGEVANLPLAPDAESSMPASIATPQRSQRAQPPSGGRNLEAAVPALATSKAIRAAYDAKLAQLEYQRAAEELVSTRQVKAEAFDLGRALRDGLMRLPDRLAPTLAATADARQVHHLLSEEIRVALRSLGE